MRHHIVLFSICLRKEKKREKQDCKGTISFLSPQLCDTHTTRVSQPGDAGADKHVAANTTDRMSAFAWDFTVARVCRKISKHDHIQCTAVCFSRTKRGNNLPQWEAAYQSRKQERKKLQTATCWCLWQLGRAQRLTWSQFLSNVRNSIA